jgi:hypothetical protein
MTSWRSEGAEAAGGATVLTLELVDDRTGGVEHVLFWPFLGVLASLLIGTCRRRQRIVDSLAQSCASQLAKLRSNSG